MYDFLFLIGKQTLSECKTFDCLLKILYYMLISAGTSLLYICMLAGTWCVFLFYFLIFISWVIDSFIYS